MRKGLPIGIVLGAALAFGLFKAVASRRAEAGPAAAAANAKPAAGATSPQVDAVRADLAAAEEEGRALAGTLRDLEAKAAAAAARPVAPAAKASRNPWADLGGRIFRLRDKFKNKDERSDPEIQEMMLAFLEVAKRLQDEHGMTMDQLGFAPWGLPMMMLAVLEASDCPPDAEQAAKLNAVIERAEAQWEQFAKSRDEMSALEQTRALLGLETASPSRLQSLLTSEQTSLLQDLELFKGERLPIGRNSTSASTREAVAAGFLDSWSSSLKLNDTQKISVSPVVDEYIREYEALQADFAAKEASGQKPSELDRAVAEVDLMLRTQKRIAGTLRLSEEQTGLLRAWDDVYEFTLKK